MYTKQCEERKKPMQLKRDVEEHEEKRAKKNANPLRRVRREEGWEDIQYMYNEDECSPLPEELKQRAERCGVEIRKLKSTAEVV